jgi:hypothetical protein
MVRTIACFIPHGNAFQMPQIATENNALGRFVIEALLKLSGGIQIFITADTIVSQTPNCACASVTK